jgi:hypothetical protein
MKKLLIVIAVIIVLSGALLYYLYSKITYTPDWYNDHQFNVNSQIFLESKGTTAKIYDELSRNKSSILDENDLNALILEKINEQIPEKSAQVVKALRSEVYQDKIVIESVINLDEVPLKNISPKYQNAVKNFLSSFPQKSRQNFYIKISGKPIRNNNRIELDPEAKIQLAKMEYSLQTVLKQISGSNKFNTYIPVNDLPFGKMHIEEDRIILEE